MDKVYPGKDNQFKKDEREWIAHDRYVEAKCIDEQRD